MRYEYRCDQNHEMRSPRPITRCLAIVKGKPCPGKLTRFGKGSRTPTEREPSDASS